MYFYTTSTQQNTNGTANTDTLLAAIQTVAASHRARLVRFQGGCYVAPTDNNFRLRVGFLTTLGTYAAGGAITPTPSDSGAPAANVTASSLPTLGTGVFGAVPPINIAANIRNGFLWAALQEDEKIGMNGAGPSLTASLIVNSQATVSSIPVNFKLVHQE
jgi:hypothetical protein